MILEIGMAVIGALLIVWIAGRLLDAWQPRIEAIQEARIQQQANLIKLQHMENQAKLRAVKVFAPDEHGQLGVAYDASTGRYINLITQTVFDQWQIHNFDPVRERLAAIERLMLASGERSQEAQEVIAASTSSRLPEQISIQDVLGTRTPSLDDLTIGVTLDEEGRLLPVSRSIYDLLHLFAVGITGSGKSTWLLAFLAQIEMCPEPIEIMLIDVHGSAFNLCSDWSKLRYPIARTNEQAKAILDAVRVESERRSVLYEAVPLAEDLASYNAHAETPLVPWLVVIDEGTLMLADRDISSYVAKSVQGTRQFGLLVFVTGQTANTTSMPSPIRDNFATRLCYTTSATSMRVALGDTPPGELEEIPGRGWALLRGKKTPIKIQSPYIRRDKLYQMIGHDGPKLPMPEIDSITLSNFDARVQAAWDAGLRGPTAICREVTSQSGGQAFYDVKDAMDRLGLTSTTTE